MSSTCAASKAGRAGIGFVCTARTLMRRSKEWYTRDLEKKKSRPANRAAYPLKATNYTSAFIRCCLAPSSFLPFSQ